MFDFKFPSVEDRKWMHPILSQSGNMGSESAFGTLFLWSSAYFSEVCRYRDYMILYSGGPFHTYNMPIGGRGLPFDAIEAIIRDAGERGIPFKMWGITQDGVAELQEMYPDRFDFQLDRDGSDYLYNTRDLIDLPGRKFHGKRNHVAQFGRAYDWSYEEISSSNYAECLQIDREWRESRTGEEREGVESETEAIQKAFEHYEALELSGGLIRVEGRPVAFTVGEEINREAFLIHFEKALDGYIGLYAAINREFAAQRLSGYRYVNREEDMGIEGLRKAKLSYCPAALLQKYAVTLRGEGKGATP